MTSEQVAETLLQYRSNAAMADYHSAQLAELNRELRLAKAEMVLDCQSLTAQISDMPHGTDISDQTGRLAVKFADGYETERVKQIKAEIENVRSQMEHYKALTMYVDAWLKCLTERQRFVVTEKTINAAYIRDIKVRMHEKFGEFYSDNGIRKIEKAALKTICDLVVE